MQGIGLNTLDTQPITDLVSVLKTLKPKIDQVQEDLGNACSAKILDAIKHALTDTNDANIDYATKTLEQAVTDMGTINATTKSNEVDLVTWIRSLSTSSGGN